MTGIRTDPMLTVRSIERARGQEDCVKETPIGEKETPHGERATNMAKK